MNGMESMAQMQAMLDWLGPYGQIAAYVIVVIAIGFMIIPSKREEK